MTYTIAIKPAGKGQITATSSDGFHFLTTTPLCESARHWLSKGANPATFIVTVWSSDSTEWSLRSSIGEAAKLTVKSDKLGKPVFQRNQNARESIAPRLHSS